MGKRERIFNMKLTGTQVWDKGLMDKALKDFNKHAKKKFLSGIKEHNPDGLKGICMMSMKDRVSSAKEEVMDLWFYLCALEDGIDMTTGLLIKSGLNDEEMTPERFFKKMQETIQSKIDEN